MFYLVELSLYIGNHLELFFYLKEERMRIEIRRERRETEWPTSSSVPLVSKTHIFSSLVSSARKEWYYSRQSDPPAHGFRIGLPFQEKYYSTEHGANRDFDSFLRQNSICFAEQKTLGILSWAIPWKGKKLGISFRTNL